MRFAQATSVGLVTLALAALVATPAAAELPPPVCNASWWVPATMPLELSNVPLQPTILLPARWDRRSNGDPTPDDWAPPIMTVAVTTASGAVVEGEVGIIVPQPNERWWLMELDYVAWWRPLAPLEAGKTYTVALEVEGPPGASEYLACQFEAFGATLTVTPAEPGPPPPTLALEVWTEDLLDRVVMYTHEGCLEVPGRVPCDGRDDVCCEGSESLSRLAHVIVTAEGTTPAPPVCYALEVTIVVDGLNVASQT